MLAHVLLMHYINSLVSWTGVLYNVHTFLCLLSYWWRYLFRSPNVGSQKGFECTTFGLSGTNHCHSTVNISNTTLQRYM